MALQMCKWGYFNILKGGGARDYNSIYNWFGAHLVRPPKHERINAKHDGPFFFQNLCLGLQFLAIYVNISEVV